MAASGPVAITSSTLWVVMTPFGLAADQLPRVPACLGVRVDEYGHELELRMPLETPDYLGADATRVELSQSNHAWVPLG